MEEKKSYYAIIPANVRYDENICANAKLLYGEITALCNEKGYCWASNKYFAELYGVSAQAISKWINALEKQGYLKTKMIYENNAIKERHIYIGVSTNDEGVSTNIDGGINKSLIGYQQKFKDNNTLNNTINNKYNTYGEYGNVKFTQKQYEDLIKTFPYDYEKRIESLDNYIQSKGAKYKDHLATLKNWARKDKEQQQKTQNRTSKVLEEFLKEHEGEDII